MRRFDELFRSFPLVGFMFSTIDDEGQIALRAIVKHDFTSFVARTLGAIDPGARYERNWHIDAIGEHLEACRKKQITRLIINLPPRSLKSVCVSVAWPAYLLGKDPTSRILAASYVSSLSLKHSLDCRYVMQTSWYQTLFPKTTLESGQKERHKFVTTRRGYRLATSVGASAVGEGGGYLILDDPLSPSQAHSRTYREAANRWFDSTFSTRLDNKIHGVIVLVMQRLHPQDLTGHLLGRSGWESLVLPALEDKRTTIVFGPIDKVRTSGELLHESRENSAHIEQARMNLGAFGFAAQYQQSPLAEEGGVIKLKWLQYYHALPDTQRRIAQSWDTAIKLGSNNDASVCMTFAETENGYYILDVMVEKLEYPELKREVLRLAERWKPDAILVEDKASGQSLLQDLRRETTLPLIAINPVGDKVTRLASVSALIEAGKLFIPEQAAWRSSFETEVIGFPNATHDDQVDAMTQYLQWAKARNFEQLRVRQL